MRFGLASPHLVARGAWKLVQLRLLRLLLPWRRDMEARQRQL